MLWLKLIHVSNRGVRWHDQQLANANHPNTAKSVAHYSDVIMGAMASHITSLTVVYLIVYAGADKKNIKASRHWPLCREFTSDRWIPRTKGQ